MYRIGRPDEDARIVQVVVVRAVDGARDMARHRVAVFGFAAEALGRLADASIALGLIAVGAALRLDGTPGVRGISLWFSGQ